MTRYFHHFLLKLPPEISHHIAVCFLKIYQRFCCRSTSLLRTSGVGIKVHGAPEIVFPGSVGLAAGFDKNAECFAALSRLGFGFIEVGTVTPEPQTGNPKPRLWRVSPEGLINQMGFNNCGVQVFKGNIRKFHGQCSVPLLANIGKNKNTPNETAIEDYRFLLQELQQEVDGFVVNVSSPNTVGLRDLQSVEFLEKIESLAPQKPVWVKLAPDLSKENLLELIRKVAQSPVFSGCVLTNTSREIALNDYQKTTGGYSGTKLFERVLEVVGNAREILKEKKSIIAVGGINSAERAKKMRMAGADLLEVYTAFVYQGPQLIRKLM